MFELEKHIKDTQVINIKVGDSIKIPMPTVEYEDFKIYRIHKDNCEKIAEVVDIGGLESHPDSGKCEFAIRVLSPDTSGDKHFAIYLNETKIGTDFKKKADTLREYVEEITEHYATDLPTWKIEAVGNIVKFRSPTPCAYCDNELKIEPGDFSTANINSPTITATPNGQGEVIGKKCYSVSISGIIEGNVLTIMGKQYMAGKNDTDESMKNKILNGQDLYCIPYNQSISFNTSAGNRTVVNTNNPSIKATFKNTDGSNDYYKIEVNDVRVGNIFKVNDDTIVAGASDTKSTIEAFFNVSNQGYYINDVNGSIKTLAISGTRTVSNPVAPTLILTLNNQVATATMDRYTVTIGEDVLGGNIFVLDGITYKAKQGDTAIDVAYALVGENSRTFEYYKDGALTTSALVGNKNEDAVLADVKVVSGVVCIRKQTLLDIKSLDSGCYIGVYIDDSDNEIYYTPRFKVKNKADGEIVHFDEYVLRLPIFLRDKTYPIIEEVHENINGEMMIVSTKIGVERMFVTHNVTTKVHEWIIEILKSDSVKINGEKYTFIGGYELPEHRHGIDDNRSAMGILRLDGLLATQTCG